MKIVCGSCQAKYSIADEKVAGKVFKIRCKRCSEVIVVRGDQDASPGNGSANGNGSHASYDASADAIWHVVLNGEQAGPYTPSQLGDLIRAGQLDWEAYVWSEGFENWQPIRDVSDLVAAISGQQEEQPRAVAQGGGQPSMGADPFADEAAAPVAVYAKPAAAAAVGHPGMYGGDSGPAPFETSPKAMVAAPSPRVSAEQAMTGARNENSVLFSLKNLQALATGSSAPAAAPSGGPSHRPGYAGGEGSGLIDIRALATATGVNDQQRHDSEKDALLSLGSAQAGAFGALGSPMLAPGKSDDDGSKKSLALAVLGGFALLAAAVAGVAFMFRPQATPTPTVVAAVAPPPVAAVGTPAQPPTTTAVKPQEAPSEGELRAKEREQERAAAATGNEREHEHEREAKGHEHEHGKHGASEKAEKAEQAVAKSESNPEPAEKPAKKARGGSSTLDELLDGAIGGAAKGGGPARHESAAASNLQDKPTREQVLSAMNGIKDQVKACGKGQGGVAFANVTVSGKSGRVSNVDVTGMPGEVGSCIARTVRKASFPKFKEDKFEVKFPFRM